MREADKARHAARVVDRRRLHPRVPGGSLARRHREPHRSDRRRSHEHADGFADPGGVDETGVIVQQEDVFGRRLPHDPIAPDDVAFARRLADDAQPAGDDLRQIAERIGRRRVARVVDDYDLVQQIADERQGDEARAEKVRPIARHDTGRNHCGLRIADCGLATTTFRARAYESSVSCAVRRQVISFTRANAAAASRVRRLSSPIIRSSAAASATASRVGTARPVSSLRTRSVAHPTGVTTTGSRWLIASRTTIPKPSYDDGRTSTSWLRYAEMTSASGRRSTTFTC